MANTHEHLEHAEHAEHHAHDPFDRRVAVTMAIVAACLAGISMVGHRTHNQVLQLQGDANRVRTEAAAAEVQKSNFYAWYQSKRNRQAQYETAAGLAKLMPGTADDARTAAVKGWEDKATSYNEPNKDHDSLPEIQAQGAEAGARAEKLHAEASALREEAEYVHHQANRLDLAHFGAELALVLCSIALLTKRREFWYAGIVSAVLALAITGSAYVIPHDSHAPTANSPASHDRP
jgi:hypothetical protein